MERNGEKMKSLLEKASERCGRCRLETSQMKEKASERLKVDRGKTGQMRERES